MKALAVGLLVVGMALALASPAWAAETFGIKSFENTIASNAESALATQAGSHPYALTTTIVFNHEVTGEKESFEENLNGEEVPLGEPDVFTHIYGNPKHLEVNLPAGLVVDTTATSVKCTEAQLETSPSAGGSCPAASAVGTITLYVNDFGEKIKGAVYNMVPPAGVPAELGVDPGEVGLVIHIVGRVRTGGDYGFSADVEEIGQAVSIYGLELTLWGDPSAASHDAQRGVCAASGKVAKTIEEEFWENENRNKGRSTKEYRFSCPTERTDTPLLSMPGACTGEPLATTMSVNSWQDSAYIEPPPATSPPVTGCEKLAFSPSLDVQPAPQVAAAESPTGLNVDLKLPHEESTEGLAEADLRQLTVALPPGIAISLSAANGLGACTDTPEPGRPEGEIALHSVEPVECPGASKIGEAEVKTPLLEEPLKGAVYLAQQETFAESLIGLYVVVAGDGVQIKLGGKATLDPNTGQITIELEQIPQLPVGEINLSLYGGPRAALMTPSGCGAYTVTSQLTPWRAGAPATPSSEFTVGSGCGDGFSPSFTAGTTDTQAGAFSPFSITFSREDGEQRLGGVRVVGPPGLLAALASVAQCPEPQAANGECGAASRIGEATIDAGSGEDPFWIKDGRIYLTGPTPPAEGLNHLGAPFGLSIVIPAVAGPFNLGQEVVRARVEVDPHTAQLAISSVPGVGGIPIIEKGVPLDIRTINMTIDRAGFMFNPTSCSPLSVTGTLTSTSGASLAVASPFEAVNCASLPFKPKLTALTHAKTSKEDGAYLHVKIVSGPGQANIGKLKVDLPKQLPSRLETLRKACTVAVFNANPAACPAASVVGTATVLTPVLSNTLTGPAYLVSHGGAAFPDLQIVLQGEGITLVLDGDTSIRKGVTSEAFRSLPDAPISTFDLVLDDGPHSVLGANLPAKARGSMCRQGLAMGTALTGQNGAVIKQTTKIAVSGCPKKVKKKTSRKREKKRAGKKKASKKREGK